MFSRCLFFFFNDTATTEIYTLSLHDALPISIACRPGRALWPRGRAHGLGTRGRPDAHGLRGGACAKPGGPVRRRPGPLRRRALKRRRACAREPIPALRASARCPPDRKSVVEGKRVDL